MPRFLMVMIQARGLIMLAMLSLPSRFMIIIGRKKIKRVWKKSCQNFVPKRNARGNVTKKMMMMPARCLSGVRKGMMLTGA